ncbi:VOC family protein [Nocardioides sp. Iso805N]|uniref:VOC family protein n=1 Tax=Nocardioides sp. Iso805N TaxID=1283287 RepID=UPI00036446EC|nr:VOC family protein [Nocardioides sp. Iso805N]
MSAFHPQLAHLGIFCIDLDAMIDFYCREFGMVVSDSGLGKSGKAGTKRPGAFLTADPTEHHQLALISGREPGTPPTTAQISFRVPSLAELRAFWRHVEETGIPVEVVKNHGNAWSVYIDDPDGNMIEVYAHSPWYVQQPLGEPLDLTLDEDQIMRQTEELAKTDPAARPREQWIKEMEEKLAAAQVSFRFDV